MSDEMIAERWYEEGESAESEWERFAARFVQTLIDGDSTRAYQMLSEGLRSELSYESFVEHFNAIVSIEDVPLGPAWVIMSMEGYPDMEAQELGSAYVQVGGDYNEAMSVAVAGVDGAGFEVLRIEWGRP